MYQGKFEAEYRQKRLEEKEAAKAAKRAAAQALDPNAAEIPEEPVEAPKRAPAPRPAPQQKGNSKKKKKKKANKVISTIFYTFYFLVILAFVGGTLFAVNWLNGWLTDYEASQPTAKAQEVFNTLFADPQWGDLYDRANMDDTAYEGKQAYIAYMENLVGDQELTYVETSAGLSGGKKYYVQLGEKRLGHYLLQDAAASLTDLPDWQLSEIELYVERENSILVQKVEGHTVYLNGVPVDDSYTIQISGTAADKYLPAGTTGTKLHLQKIDGLLDQPTVTVKDSSGEEVTVSWDEEKGMYIEEYTTATMGPEEKERIIEAAKTYSKFMIEEASAATLSKYFLSGTDTYKRIVRMELWMQGNDGYQFTNETVSEYTRYTEDLFSARVSLSMNVTRTNGSVKEYAVDTTLFFELQQNGKWMVYDMSMADVQEPIIQVRLTFCNDDTVLSTGFVENNATTVTAPVISVPEGQVFVGWFIKTVDENGQTVMNMVFAPGEDGVIQVPYGTTLEPLTLYAVFENI